MGLEFSRTPPLPHCRSCYFVRYTTDRWYFDSTSLYQKREMSAAVSINRWPTLVILLTRASWPWRRLGGFGRRISYRTLVRAQDSAAVRTRTSAVCQTSTRIDRLEWPQTRGDRILCRRSSTNFLRKPHVRRTENRMKKPLVRRSLFTWRPAVRWGFTVRFVHVHPVQGCVCVQYIDIMWVYVRFSVKSIPGSKKKNNIPSIPRGEVRF